MAVGEKTPLFPDGVPTGCDHDSTAFQLTFQLTKLLMVSTIAGFAFAGKKLMGFSIALMGSTMIMKGVLDLLQASPSRSQTACALSLHTRLRA